MKLSIKDLLGSKILIPNNSSKEKLLTTLSEIMKKASYGRDRFIGKGPQYKYAKYFYISYRGTIYYGLHENNYYKNNYREICPSQLGLKTMTLKQLVGEL